MRQEVQVISKKDKVWIKLMELGAYTCHQKADRSFAYKEYQYPVCARCTGLIVGDLMVLIGMLLGFGVAGAITNLILMGIMLGDWVIQFKKIKESTNRRRLITGTLAGYGSLAIIINIITYVIT